MNYLTSIQVMQSIGCMSRETVKGKRFQEILQQYVFSVSLCEMLLISAGVFSKHFSKEK